jgi:hypothetical protein
LGTAVALEEAATTLREAAAVFVGAMGGPAAMWAVWGTAGTSEGGHDGGGRAGTRRGRAAGRAAARTGSGGGGGAARSVDGWARPGRHGGGDGRRHSGG